MLIKNVVYIFFFYKYTRNLLEILQIQNLSQIYSWMIETLYRVLNLVKRINLINYTLSK